MDRSHDYDISDRDAHLAGLLSRKHYHPKLSRQEKKELAALLSAHPLLADLSQAEIDMLVPASHAFTYPADWTISAQSSCADMCFLIAQGSIAMTRNRRELSMLGPGDVVGLADAMSQRVHPEAAVSRTPVAGVAVDSGPLLAVLAAHRPQEPAQVTEVVATVAAPHLRTA